MSSRTIFLIPIILLVFIASCGEPSTGPGIIFEPVSSDQLIPLARGNYWHYRDLSGRGGERPQGRYVLHSIESVREAYPFYRDRETGTIGSRSDIPLVFYMSGENALGVSFEGIFFGTMEDEKNVAVYTSIPKNPTLGEAYAGMRCIRIEEVVTPAGTFECYRFDSHDQRESYWWSRGVGLVKYRTTGNVGEETGNWVLESYKVQSR